MNDAILTLSSLNGRISESMQSAFPHFVWVTGEISELKVNSSGHCYMELIEKDTLSDCIIARQKAIIWAYSYRMIAPYFESATGSRLVTGLKILVNVKVEYHAVYGMSLNIRDIDPKYTIGDLARRKKEILTKLKELGVIDMNRMLSLPPVPQRIAVISSESAAGYGDFINSIENNQYGFRFITTLFPSVMQGDKAESSIINALEKIYANGEKYDVVVIIRGGGASADLECFNNYELVYHIAQFPIPVITGIGHERDETIADIVAHTSLKTPTAVAEFLINLALEFSNMLETFSARLHENARERFSRENFRMNSMSKELSYMVKGILKSENELINAFFQRVLLASRQFTLRKKDNLDKFSYLSGLHAHHALKQASVILNASDAGLRKSTALLISTRKKQLADFERNVEYLDPLNVLKRGYSITSFNGKAIKDASVLNKGDILVTKFNKGQSTSEVIGSL